LPKVAKRKRFYAVFSKITGAGAANRATAFKNGKIYRRRRRFFEGKQASWRLKVFEFSFAKLELLFRKRPAFSVLFGPRNLRVDILRRVWYIRRNPRLREVARPLILQESRGRWERGRKALANGLNQGGRNGRQA
jgi:hypothetical protein